MTVQAAPATTPARTAVRLKHPALLLGALGGIIGFAGSWIPSYWGDEAASVISATRSLPSLLSELSVIDGVHGVYYGLLHVWVGLFGTSELATRLPSAIAVGLMVSGTLVLVRPLAGTRVAVLAGVILIALPRTTAMATEARSYAIGAAAAVWVTVLLMHLLRKRQTSAAQWAGYGAAVAASMWLFLYLGLVLLVHGVVVVVLYRSRLRHWLRGAGAALILGLPILLIGYLQRNQIGFLARRNYATPLNVLVKQWFGTVPVAVFIWLLITVAGIALWMHLRKPHASLPPLALLGFAWLVIPTALLLLVNVTISPIYNVRYLAFCTPAAAIVAALGIAALTHTLASRPRVWVAVALVLALGALSASNYLAQRSPYAKDGGSDLRQVAEYIGSHASAGDAVVFDHNTKPSRSPRLSLDLYPTSYAGLIDVALVSPFDEVAGLWDAVAPLAETGVGASADVWAVELANGTVAPADVTYLEAHGYFLESSTLIHRTTVYHLTKE